MCPVNVMTFPGFGFVMIVSFDGFDNFDCLYLPVLTSKSKRNQSESQMMDNIFIRISLN